MSEQVKRSPGRPKKVVAEAKPEVKTSTPKKTNTIQRKKKAHTHRVYEIKKGGGVVYMLPSKGITIYDEEKGRVLLKYSVFRENGHCPLLHSAGMAAAFAGAFSRPSFQEPRGP